MYLHGSSHPYIALAQVNAHAWRSSRVAARYNYNPFYAGYTPRQKPFDGVAPLPSVRGSGFGARTPRYLVEELVEELEYYGFDNFAEELGPP
jgi:hypothetical protein